MAAERCEGEQISPEANEKIVAPETHDNLVNSSAGPPRIVEGAEAFLEPPKTCDAEIGVSFQRQDTGELSPKVDRSDRPGLKH